VIPKILLADDCKADGHLLEVAFVDAGHAVMIDQVFDGSHALARLRLAATVVPFPYALVVLDLNMPLLTGTELLTVLRESPAMSAVPIVILTSSDSPADRDAAMAHNPDAYFIKPMNYAGLTTLVRDLMPFINTPRDKRPLTSKVRQEPFNRRVSPGPPATVKGEVESGI